MIIFYGFSWLIISVSMEISGTLLLIHTENFKRFLPTVICLSCYIISFYALSKLMSLMPPVMAYSVWSGLGIVMITILSSFFYSQKTSPLEKAGIFIIVIGITLIAL